MADPKVDPHQECPPEWLEDATDDQKRDATNDDWS